VTTSERIEDTYRAIPSDELRQQQGAAGRSWAHRAAIGAVLVERQEAYERGQEAAHVMLDAVGGKHARTLHAAAVDTMMRETEGKRFVPAHRAAGVADALWDYIQERSDT
jgi:hypothetical protein